MIEFFMSDRTGAVMYSLAFAMYLAAAALSVVLSSITNEKVWNFTAMGMMSLAASTLILSFRFNGLNLLNDEQLALTFRTTMLFSMVGALWLVMYAIKMVMKQGKK